MYFSKKKKDCEKFAQQGKSIYKEKHNLKCFFCREIQKFAQNPDLNHLQAFALVTKDSLQKVSTEATL